MNVIWLILNLSTAIRRRFRLPVNGSTRTSLKIVFYWNTTTGNNYSTDVPLLRQNVKIKGKECFSYNFRRWSGCVCLQFPWLRNHLRLINNKNTSSIRCFDYVFLYSMLFYVTIWTGMVSNRYIDQYVHVSARSHGLRSTSQQLNISAVKNTRFASQIHVHVSTPRWSMSIFLLKSDGGAPQNMRFNVFAILVCSIYGENNIWRLKSWRFTLAVEVSQTALCHAGSFSNFCLSVCLNRFI